MRRNRRLLLLVVVLLSGVAVHFSMALQLLLRRQPQHARGAAAAAFLKPPASLWAPAAAFSSRARRCWPLLLPSSATHRQGQQHRFFVASAGGCGDGGHDAELYDVVEQALKGPCGVTKGGSRLVVAVSGGSDSVALLHLLAGVRSRWQPPLALRVAHFNHGLRLPEADEEEAFVRQLGDELDVPVRVFRWGEAERARAAGIQARSRAWRRAECRQLLQELELEQEQGAGDGFVVTAHQADDQMETWALKLLRGAHLSHLRGMAYCAQDRAEQAEAEAEKDELEEEEDEKEGAADDDRGRGSGAAAAVAATVTFIKPLLGVPKARLARFLEARGLKWREDASNAVADKYKRNRVRLQLLPLMAELAGGEAALQARVGALSAQSEALDGWLAEAAAAWEARQQQTEAQGLRPNELWVGGGALTTAALPRLVEEEVVHRFVARATGGALRALPYAQVDRVLRRLAKDAAGDDAGGSGAGIAWRLFLAQGWVLDRQGQVLRVSHEASETDAATAATAAASASGAAVVAFLEAGLELVGLPLGWQAAAERLPPGAAAEEEAAEAEGAMVLHGLPHGTRLRCRRRRDGDRFHPAWRPGPVKLKDFLRGQRVPLHRRDEVLLLCLEGEGGEEGASAEVVVGLVDPPFVARPFCGGVASSSEPGAAALALRISEIAPEGEE